MTTTTMRVPENLAGNFVSTMPRVVTLKSPVAFQRARSRFILCIFDAFGRFAASPMCLIIVIRSLILYTHILTCRLIRRLKFKIF